MVLQLKPQRSASAIGKPVRIVGARCVRPVLRSAVALVWRRPAWSQTVAPGRAQYDQFCARCHGGDGRGGQMGPGIVARLAADDRMPS